MPVNRDRTLAALILVGLSAAGELRQGRAAFPRRQTRRAVSVLEKAILEPGTDERAWLYLALSYQQLGRLDEAAAVLRKGLDQAVRFKALYLFRPRQYLRTSRKELLCCRYVLPSHRRRRYFSSGVPQQGGRPNRCQRTIAGRRTTTSATSNWIREAPKASEHRGADQASRRGDRRGAQAAAAAEAKKEAEEAARKKLLDQVGLSQGGGRRDNQHFRWTRERSKATATSSRSTNSQLQNPVMIEIGR